MWRELIWLIRNGRYFPPGQTRDSGYCSNIVDVRLLDALDLLHALDEDAGRLVPRYERIFSQKYTGMQCRCPPCEGGRSCWRWLVCYA